jgi:hypothetical protein
MNQRFRVRKGLIFTNGIEYFEKNGLELVSVQTGAVG